MIAPCVCGRPGAAAWVEVPGVGPRCLWCAGEEAGVRRVAPWGEAGPSMRPSCCGVLAILTEAARPLRVEEVFAEADLSKGTVRGSLVELEHLGLVRHKTLPDNGRPFLWMLA